MLNCLANLLLLPKIQQLVEVVGACNSGIQFVVVLYKLSARAYYDV